MSIIRRAQLETPLSASYANSSSYAETASFALNGGGGSSNINTGSFVTTSSFAAFTSSYNTGSFTGSFTGTLIGTSSWAVSASRAVSSSYTLTASYVNPLQQDVIITGSIYIPDSTYGIYFSGSSAASKLTWNNTDGTLDLGLKGGDVTLQIGQESVIRVVNKTGANLLESQYKAVRIRRVDEGGAQGQRLAIVLAQANNDANSVDTLGLVTENINNNQEGFITTSGLVRNVDTTGTLQGETWADGDALYLSPTTAGAITKVKPQAPQHTVTVGYVVYAHVNNGKIFVKVDNGYEIDELHNVRITTSSLSSGDLLVYSSSVWINSKQLTGSYQITGSLTITNNLTVSDSIDSENRYLYDSSGISSVEWNERTFRDSGGRLSLDWNARQLKTLSGYNVNYNSDRVFASDTFLSDNISGSILEDFATNNDGDWYAGHAIQGQIVNDIGVVCKRVGQVDWYRPRLDRASEAGTLLGIRINATTVLLQGDITINDSDSGIGFYVNDGGFTMGPGYKVYLNTSGMSLAVPTSGYVRELGYIYYASTDDNNQFIMRFNPSNDYYLLS